MSKKPNKAERKRFDDFRHIGCVVCGSPNYEVHHVRHSGKRDNIKTFPLCHVHHRTGGYGVAIHDGLATWEKNFDSEQHYLDYTNTLLTFQDYTKATS